MARLDIVLTDYNPTNRELWINGTGISFSNTKSLPFLVKVIAQTTVTRYTNTNLAIHKEVNMW